MGSILIAWLVTSISLLIISKLPLGIEIDGFGKAILSAAVFGILNAFLRPVLGFLAFPITLITFGLFALVLNAIIFGLAALLVHGFRLRWGIWSALTGALALSVINSLIYRLLPGLAV
ncbi:MAG TPA: phage holin family protein [Candidatus Caenarcaniphilales bacterium]